MPNPTDTLGPGQNPVTMSRYPHMMDLDTLVWTAYLAGDHPPISRVWYDLHVGDPIQVPPDSPPGLLAIADGTGMKRIDVVALVMNTLWIIELKPYGNHAALGQVILYADLFRRRYGSRTPIVPTIICDTGDDDVAHVAESLKIQYIVTGPVGINPFTRDGTESIPE